MFGKALPHIFMSARNLVIMQDIVWSSSCIRRSLRLQVRVLLFYIGISRTSGVSSTNFTYVNTFIMLVGVWVPNCGLLLQSLVVLLPNCRLLF